MPDSIGDSKRQLLRALEGYGDDADAIVEQIRSRRGQPRTRTIADVKRQTAVVPDQTPDVLRQSGYAGAEIDRLMRGTEADRRQVELALGDPVSWMYPQEPGDVTQKLAAYFSGGSGSAVQQRIEELQAEIPHVGTDDGFLASTWGRITDVGGNVLGSAMQLLELPADLTERTIGMFYWNEIPSWGDRWNMAELTYDSMWDQAFSGGDKNAPIRDFVLRMSHEEIVEEHTSAWGDAIGKIALDPLWLVGGIPLVTKVPVLGRTTAARAVNQGLDFSRIPGLNKIPVVQNIGRRTESRILDESLELLYGTDRRALNYARRTHSGFLRRAFELSRSSKAAADMDHFTTVFSSLGADPRVWLGNGAPLNKLLDDLGNGLRPSGALGRAQPLLDSTPGQRISQLLQQDGGLAQSLRNLDSLQPIDESKDLWAGARTALQDGDENILDLLRSGARLSPEQVDRYTKFRNATFTRELMQVGQRELNRIHFSDLRSFGPIPLDFWEAAGRLAAAIKAPLAFTHLNSPRFMVMNWGSNAAHIATKGEDLGSAARYALGFGRRSRRITDFAERSGLGDEVFQALSRDDSFLKETAGSLAGVRDVRKNRLLWFFNQGNNLDTGLRDQGFSQFAQKMANSVWDWEAPISGTNQTRGIIPALPPELENLGPLTEQLKSMIGGMTLDGPAAVDRLTMAFQDTDDLLTGYDLADQYARRAWAAANPGVIPSRTNGPAQIKDMMHESIIDMVGEVIDDARTARRAGDSNYLQNAMDSLDEMMDDIDLEVFELRHRANLPPVSLPMGSIRGRPVEWQDEAQALRHHERTTQHLGRLMGMSYARFGGKGQAKRWADITAQAMDEFYRDARALRDTMRKAPKAKVTKPKSPRRSAETFRQMLDEGLSPPPIVPDEAVASWIPEAIRRYAVEYLGLLDRRNAAIESALGNAGRQIADDWAKFAKAERNQFVLSSGERLDALKVAPEEIHSTWANAVRKSHVDQNALFEDWVRTTKLEFRDVTEAAQFPTAAGAYTAVGDQMQQFIRHVKSELPRRFSRTQQLTPEQFAKLREYARGPLRDALNLKEQAMTIAGRKGRDWLALNYSRKYGLDQALSVIFPYHFWIGRTLNHWGKMTMARPGFTSAYADLYSMIGEINEDANLPDRLKNSIAIPIPFLDDALGKLNIGPTTGAMYFDPLRTLWPLAQFQNDEDFNNSADRTPLGRLVNFAEQFGAGASPFITGPLGATGALGDRDAYVRRATALPVLPLGLPGSRLSQAAWDWLAGTSEDPDPALLTEEVKAAIVAGEPLPEDLLRSQTRGVWQSAQDGLNRYDGFDDYRIDRTIAAMVAEEPQRYTPRLGMEAMRYRTGALYEEAERRAFSERAMTGITGWLFMPMRVYPEGEQIQRGLDAIWNEVRAENDPEQIDEFFTRYPEYQLRRTAVMDRGDPDGQLRELDTSLFFMDLAEIESKYDPEIDEMRDLIRTMERQGALELKEGRNYIAATQGEISYLSALKQEEISRLEALYPNRRVELSLRASPRERALFELREEYFQIQRKNFRSDEEYYAARDEFLAQFSNDDTQQRTWLEMAVESIVLTRVYDERAAAAGPEAAGSIREARDEALRKLTRSARPHISRPEFMAYLSVGSEPPTMQRMEYERARTELAEYFAIDEAPGLRDDTKRQYQRQFWSEHPLLQRYYGDDEPEAWNADSAAAFGRMDQIWSGYYEVRADAQAARDYLARNLPELNSLRARVGMRALQLRDYSELQPGAFQQEPTDPHEMSLQQQALGRSGNLLDSY